MDGFFGAFIKSLLVILFFVAALRITLFFGVLATFRGVLALVDDLVVGLGLILGLGLRLGEPKVCFLAFLANP